eukprot:m.1278617 g.1278617  ORF g.1278617 m.1278617 type:complete len:326 (+) comp24765_c0_seq4:2511-3488(+)
MQLDTKRHTPESDLPCIHGLNGHCNSPLARPHHSTRVPEPHHCNRTTPTLARGVCQALTGTCQGGSPSSTPRAHRCSTGPARAALSAPFRVHRVRLLFGEPVQRTVSRGNKYSHRCTRTHANTNSTMRCTMMAWWRQGKRTPERYGKHVHADPLPPPRSASGGTDDTARTRTLATIASTEGVERFCDDIRALVKDGGAENFHARRMVAPHGKMLEKTTGACRHVHRHQHFGRLDVRNSGGQVGPVCVVFKLVKHDLARCQRHRHNAYFGLAMVGRGKRSRVLCDAHEVAGGSQLSSGERIVTVVELLPHHRGSCIHVCQSSSERC